MEAYTHVLGDYLLNKTLGKGQFSKVKVGVKDGVKYAAKYMNLEKIPEAEKPNVLGLLIAETNVMKQLDHPNIVKLHEYSDNGKLVSKEGVETNVLYLILDLIKGGELFDYILLGGKYSEPYTRFYFWQFMNALEYLHAKGFAHRDIKPENLLMDENCMLKLADFGFTSPMSGKSGGGLMYSSKGTEGYMAPEIMLGQPYKGDKVDVFAAGVVLFIMVAQRPPFNHAHSSDKFYKMLVQDPAKFWAAFAKWVGAGTFSAPLKDLLNRMMAFDPEQRPSVAEIKAHPWMAGPQPSPAEIKMDFLSRTKSVKMDQEAKREEARMKRLAKKEAAKKKMAGGFAYAPGTAVRAGIGEEKQVAVAVKKALKLYKVFSEKE